ncbi:hypothetical protein BDP27DRAFT_1359763 [Rhodocollybia butyracea]|uniref:Uncharacterized protein n=1 Tax=Rhodocollybia butyracea TaxID=206335 RepID=A0A9P5UCL6_9AGAR|nr:hypothetical protein BDP27DRAFT_1359763 [Rhodocollybia butyracea]
MAALYNAPPANTVAVMLLVDNNHFTKIAWSDLRDQCLPALFSRLSSVHPSALITTFVQESCSTNSDQTLIEIPPAHREYYAYQDAIRDGSIYCHLMLHASTVSPTEPLNLLFDESLRLQKMAEDKPWFSNNRSLIIPRLSLVRSPVPQERNISPTSIRPMYPQAPSASSEEEALPSLVTQLQQDVYQMHGLTKKKVYGTKPKRRPFVSAEVYREHPRKASSLSPVLPSDTNHGGRVTSPSLIDRASRVSQNGTPLSHSSALRSMSDVGPKRSSVVAPWCLEVYAGCED